ncbi:hypothetical protein [Streptomyces sp. NPDC005181]|uniref:hypothetical protein n=1 Tax=Streptomyces sp. NPDC005181 TaxID=3156869 RepID=UPI0033B0F444
MRISVTTSVRPPDRDSAYTSALASTGSDIPAGALFAASGIVVAAGAGVVVAARRRTV